VSFIAALLREFPAAQKYKLQLQALENENGRLKTENAALKDELAQYTDQWATLDGPAVNALIYLSQYERGNATQIAEAYRMNIRIAETYLGHLEREAYVQSHSNGEAAHYGLARRGRRYLRERGFLK